MLTAIGNDWFCSHSKAQLLQDTTGRLSLQVTILMPKCITNSLEYDAYAHSLWVAALTSWWEGISIKAAREFWESCLSFIDGCLGSLAVAAEIYNWKNCKNTSMQRRIALRDAKVIAANGKAKVLNITREANAVIPWWKTYIQLKIALKWICASKSALSFYNICICEMTLHQVRTLRSSSMATTAKQIFVTIKEIFILGWQRNWNHTHLQFSCKMHSFAKMALFTMVCWEVTCLKRPLALCAFLFSVFRHDYTIWELYPTFHRWLLSLNWSIDHFQGGLLYKYNTFISNTPLMSQWPTAEYTFYVKCSTRGLVWGIYISAIFKYVHGN